jgi:hypothetical protein
MDHVAVFATGGVELAKFAADYQFPEFVKKAGQEETVKPILL